MPINYDTLSDEELLKLVEKEKVQQPVINYDDLSDEELLKLVEDEKQNGQLQIDPTLQNLNPEKGPLQGGVVENIFGVGKRAAEVGAEAVTQPLQDLGTLFDQIFTQVKTDPLGSAAEVGRTANALLNPLDAPAKGINELLGGRPNEIQDTNLAALFGIGKGAEDLLKGAVSLPADISNTLDYIFTGDRSGDSKPLFDVNLYGDNTKIDELLAKEPLSGTLGRLEPLFTPLSLTSKATKGLKNVKGLEKFATEPVVGAALEGTTGFLTEPQRKDDVERFESRAGQGFLSAIPGAASGSINAVKRAGRVQELVDKFNVPLPEAKSIISNAPESLPITDFLSKQAKRIKGAKRGLLPEETAQFKDLDVVGSKKAVIKDLKDKLQVDDIEAEGIYSKAVNRAGLRSKGNYWYRQQIDKDINTLLHRQSYQIKGKTNREILGGVEGIKELRRTAIVRETNKLAEQLNIKPIEAKRIVEGFEHPTQFLGTADILSPYEAFRANFLKVFGGGTLTTGRLTNTTKRAGEIFEQARTSVANQVGQVADGFEKLNDIQGRMVNELTNTSNLPEFVKPLSRDILSRKSGLDDLRNDGTLYRMLAGDIEGIAPDIVNKLQPFIDELREFNVNEIHPKINEIWGKDYELDPGKLTNSQQGRYFYRLNLQELAKTVDNYDEVLKQYNTGPLDDEGKIIKPLIPVGYGNSKVDVIKHFETAKQVYEKEFPFLYDEAGKFRKELLTENLNNRTAQADLEMLSKLDRTQAVKIFANKKEFIENFQSHTSLSKKEIGEIFDEAVITGNMRPTNKYWSKFVGSIQKSDNKLIMKNVDPFKTMGKQYVDLVKKQTLEPVIDKIREAKIEIDKQLKAYGDVSTDALPWNAKWRLETEQRWFDEVEAIFRRTPSDFDLALTDMIEGITEGPWKDLALKHTRKFADSFVTWQALLKLGGNFSGSMMQVFESLYSAGPELLTDLDVLKKMILQNPLDAPKNIDKTLVKMRNSQYAPLLVGRTGKQTGMTSSAFSAGRKFLGSEVLGVGRDLLMKPFQEGTTLGKVIAFSIYDELGQSKGLKGKALDDFIVTMMTKRRQIPDLNRLPFTERNQIARVALVFQDYLVNMFDIMTEKYGQVLENPSPQNIGRAISYDLAPGLLFGTKATVTGGVALSAFEAFTGIKNAALGEEQEPSLYEKLYISEKPSEQLLAGGLAGQLGMDTSLFDRNIMSLWGPFFGTGNFLGPSELESVIETSKRILDINRELKDESLLEAQKKAYESLVINTARNESVLVNRLWKGAQVAKDGQFLDRAGQTITEPILPVDIPGASPELDKTLTNIGAGLFTAVGGKSKEVLTEQFNVKQAKFLEKKYENHIDFLNKEAKQAAIRVGKALKKGNAVEIDAANRIFLQLFDEINKESIVASDVTAYVQKFNSLYTETINKMDYPALMRLLDGASDKQLAFFVQSPYASPRIKNYANLLLQQRGIQIQGLNPVIRGMTELLYNNTEEPSGNDEDMINDFIFNSDERRGR